MCGQPRFRYLADATTQAEVIFVANVAGLSKSLDVAREGEASLWHRDADSQPNWLQMSLSLYPPVCFPRSVSLCIFLYLSLPLSLVLSVLPAGLCLLSIHSLPLFTSKVHRRTGHMRKQLQDCGRNLHVVAPILACKGGTQPRQNAKLVHKSS